MSTDHRQYQGSEREHNTAALFPVHGSRVHAAVARWVDNGYYDHGWAVSAEETHQCARCGSLVLDRDQHVRWHASTDSAATTELGR